MGQQSSGLIFPVSEYIDRANGITSIKTPLGPLPPDKSKSVIIGKAKQKPLLGKEGNKK